MVPGPGNSPKTKKFPVLFPVSREFGAGYGFDYDWVAYGQKIGTAGRTYIS
jgi:hypothetical protein